MTTSDVEDWLVSWFADRGRALSGGREQILATRYLEDGVLDSVMMIELVMEAESHFGFRFASADFNDPRLPVFGGLVEIIAAALARR